MNNGWTWALFWSLVVAQLVSAFVLLQWLLSIAGTDLTALIK